MSDTLTIAQAKIAIQLGHKIRHRFFQPDEYVMIRNEDQKLIDENGQELIPKLFWGDRVSKEHFQDGWSVIEDTNDLPTTEKM